MAYVLKNLLAHANAENAGWTASNGSVAYVTTPRLAGNYAIKLTSTSSNETLVFESTYINLIKNHVYYACVHIYENTNAVSYLQCYWPEAEPYMVDDDYGYGTPPGPYLNVSKCGEWQRVSFRAIRSNWSTNTSGRFRWDFEGFPSGSICYIDNMMLIDLTDAFGYGNEPTKQWCDENLPFFETTYTIEPLSVKVNIDTDEYTEFLLTDSLTDLSKNSYKPTVVGNIVEDTLVTHNGHNTLYLDGASYFTINIPNKGEDFTVECWFKQEAVSSDYPTLLNYNDTSGDSARGLYQHLMPAFSTLAANTSLSWVGLSGGIDKYLGLLEWNHLAYTYSNNVLKAFVNGVYYGQITNAYSDYETLCIGTLRHTISTCYFKGWVQNIRFSSCVRYNEHFNPPELAVWAPYKTLSVKCLDDSIEYKRIPYIESTEEQYIDTSYYPNNNTKILFDASINNGTYLDSTSPYLYYGCRTGSTNYFSLGQGAASNNYTIHGYFGTTYTTVTTLTAQTLSLRRTWIQDRNNFYVQNATKTATDSSWQSNYSLYLFASNESGTVNYRTPLRLYGCKIYEKDELVRDFIPMKRMSDNMVGLWDNVEGKFYADAAGGNFLYYDNNIDDNIEKLMDGASLTVDSKNGDTITSANGTVELRPFGKVNDNSYYFPGNDKLILTNSASTSGTNDWTIEWWEYPTTQRQNCARFHHKYSSSINNYGMLIGYQPSNSATSSLTFYLSTNGTSWNLASGVSMGTLVLNAWTHRAVVRKGGYIYLFENGVKKNTVSIGTSASISAVVPPEIGVYENIYYYYGYLDNIRIYKEAKYTANFIPEKKKMLGTSKQCFKNIINAWVKTSEPIDVEVTNLLPAPLDWSLSSVAISDDNEFVFATGTTAMATTPLATPKEGHLYYGRVNQKTTSSSHSASDGRFEMFCGDNEFQANLIYGYLTEIKTNNEWVNSSKIYSLQSSTYLTSSNTWQLRNFVVNANGVCYRKEPLLIDLTECFGAGNEPTKEWCDENIPYFIGTITIEDGRKCWTKKTLI